MIKFYIIWATMLLLAWACQHDVEYIEKNTEVVKPELLRDGWVRMKFKELPENIESLIKQGMTKSCVDEVGKLFEGVKVIDMKRVFPFSGQFEERSRKEGLHLWYDLYLEGISEQRGIAKTKSSFAIDVIEADYQIRLLDEGHLVPFVAKANSIGDSEELPYNDPYLKAQWHYYNNGTLSNSIQRADINILDVWKQNYKIKDVVVAIVDQGVDVSHVDLAGNFYINQLEYNGLSGKDDDDNGYIDDIYGWNFVTNTPILDPTIHGTHVAGLVGAENNNGIGVCGVAGGYGNHTGCKMICCQIINQYGQTAANVPAAIKYAADRGAVICQNSWIIEKGEFPESLKDAIDYFVKYAGMDKDGKQVGLMQGGLVVFAAGNQNLDGEIYPACYENVLAVSGFAPDFTKAHYSNFGSWVDIAAPGGSVLFDGKYGEKHMILSTIPDNQIGYLEGTSMAAPQVSGVAALMVAKYGGKGFTANHLRARLLASTKNIDQYNQNYIGKLGVGAIDASKAFQAGILELDPVSNIVCTSLPGAIRVQWEGIEVGNCYKVFWSRSNFVDWEQLPNDCQMIEVPADAAVSGKTFECILPNMQTNSEYCIGIMVYDEFGNHSNLEIQNGSVLPNQAPIIVRRGSGDVILPYKGMNQVVFEVSDPEGGELTYRIEDETKCTSDVRNGNAITINLNHIIGVKGRHVVHLFVQDEEGLESCDSFEFVVAANQPPTVVGKIQDFWFEGLNANEMVDLANVFNDPENGFMQYEFEYDKNVVYLRTDGNRLHISVVGSGYTDVVVRASDGSGTTVETTFKVQVKEDSSSLELYPNPVFDELNIRMGKDVDGKVQVRMYASNGAQILNSFVEVSPFIPGVLDVSKIAGGRYVVEVEYKGEKYVSNIIKL